MSSIEERLYLETDSSCAHCGFRDQRALTTHHIDCDRSDREAYDNKIVLCHNCHQCHHQGKGPSCEELITLKKRLIIKTLTQPGLNAMKAANRRGTVIAIPFLVNHLQEFSYLSFEEECMTHVINGGPEQVTLGCYSLTDAGRRLLDTWDLK